MEVCISMVRDELEDSATPVIRKIIIDDDMYDNHKFNEENSMKRKH
jgi:hypothetical protein